MKKKKKVSVKWKTVTEWKERESRERKLSGTSGFSEDTFYF